MTLNGHFPSTCKAPLYRKKKNKAVHQNCALEKIQLWLPFAERETKITTV